MEEINEQFEQQSEQSVEGNKAEAISNEPLAGIDELPEANNKPIIERQLIEDEVEYRNATEEEKVLHCATTMVLEIIKNKIINDGEKQLLLERTIRKVRSERATMFQQLNEAEQELYGLKWNNILPQSLTQMNHSRVGGRVVRTQRSAGGLRGIYIITFGNFVLAKENKWIYRPTQDQMMKLVNRFNKQKQCESYATNLRTTYKATIVKDGPKETEVENKSFTEFKKDLLDQINELRATV